MACNTSNIKEMKYGRPQTVMFERQNAQPVVTYPNGTIVDLGITLEASNIPGGVTPYGRAYDHVHKVEQTKAGNAGNANPVAAVEGKWIVVAPEINVEEYRRIHGRIDGFKLDENTTYSAYRLQKHDRIEYTFSDDRFEGDVSTFTAGAFVNIDNNGKFAVALGGNVNDSAFRVVTVVDTHLPFVLAANGQQGQNASLLPTVDKKIKLEVLN